MLYLREIISDIWFVFQTWKLSQSFTFGTSETTVFLTGVCCYFTKYILTPDIVFKNVDDCEFKIRGRNKMAVTQNGLDIHGPSISQHQGYKVRRHI